MDKNDALQVQCGRGGYCLVTIRDGEKEYSLPLVYWPEIEEVIRADFYKWAELARSYTEGASILAGLRGGIGR